MERFEGTIPPTYFRSAKCVIFVYSVIDMDSVNNIENWIESVSPQRMQYMGVEGIVRVLVGNKIDLEDENDVTTDRGKEVAENCGVDRDMFFEISALEGTGFDEMLEAIVREIRHDQKESSNTATLSLSDSAKKNGISTRCSGCMR